MAFPWLAAVLAGQTLTDIFMNRNAPSQKSVDISGLPPEWKTQLSNISANEINQLNQMFNRTSQSSEERLAEMGVRNQSASQAINREILQDKSNALTSLLDKQTLRELGMIDSSRRFQLQENTMQYQSDLNKYNQKMGISDDIFGSLMAMITGKQNQSWYEGLLDKYMPKTGNGNINILDILNGGGKSLGKFAPDLPLRDYYNNQDQVLGIYG